MSCQSCSNDCTGNSTKSCLGDSYSRSSSQIDISEDLAQIKNYKQRSGELTGDRENKDDWVKRSAARAMMRAVGYKDEDFQKPLVAIAAPFTNITPCNGKILELAQTIHAEVEKLGMKGYYFGTPVVTDGEAMGMQGMKYSLPSRDLIADSIEMMTESYQADAVITLCGCDKTIPGALMPIARNDLIGITLYGGSIMPGNYKGRDLNIVSAFEAIGQYSKGQIDYEEFMNIERNSCPGCGSCGGMYTANTMASSIEALGMSLPYSSSNPATNRYGRISESKYDDCILTARSLVRLLSRGISAKDIITRKSLENALTLVFALGGSTNAVLHFLAIARDAGVELEIEDFNKIGSKVPLIADMKPSGKYVMYDLFRVGGVPMVMKHLLDEGLLHGDCLTVTGQTVAENLRDAPSLQNYLQLVKRNQEKFFVELKQEWVEQAFS